MTVRFIGTMVWAGVVGTVLAGATRAAVSSAEGNAPAMRSKYDAPTRTLDVTTDAGRRFKYVFNKGGAICEMYDLDVNADANLVGESFRGESTDRVIQWTYWNARYRGQPHKLGSRDTRANVTMEGCYDGEHEAEVLETPKSGAATTLTFRSRIRHWFFAVLDRHGTPDFETTSRYDILNDGSVKLTRSVLRRPWKLRGVTVRTWDGKRWQESKPQDTTMVAKHVKDGSVTSYIESWTPLRRTVLPHQRHARGAFKKDGYRFWRPKELGGWAMAYSDKQAVAVVFGMPEDPDDPDDKTEKQQQPPANPSPQLRLVYNKLDLPNHRLNILLPGIETDWPDHATLTQTLIFIVGQPNEVMQRAEKLVAKIPMPVMRQSKKDADQSERSTP